MSKMSRIKPGYTIVVKDPDSYNGSLMPIRDDAKEVLTFDTPNMAYEYFRDKYWSDTKDFYIIEFHDFEVVLAQPLSKEKGSSDGKE